MKRKNQICTLNLWAGDVLAVRALNCPTRHRLAQAFSRLQSIQLVRNHVQDPLFGKSTEDRIIWRELLDLELQDVDEQIDDYQRLQETLALAESFRNLKEDSRGEVAISRSGRGRPPFGS
jgi:hypothetical protein